MCRKESETMKLGKKKNEVVKPQNAVDAQTRNVNINEIKQVESAKKKGRKKKQEKLGFNWVLFVCMIIIAIPCGLFLWILLSAMQDTGTPILGNRFLNDLNPAIETAQVEQIDQKVEALAGIEACDTNLIVATLRLTVDVSDDLTNEEVKALAVEVFNVVNEVTPMETYFTFANDQKQYDLEMNVYNNLSFVEDFIMYNVVKNSYMDTYLLQDVSTPIDAQLAQDLRDYVIERDKPEEETDDSTDESEDSTEE